MGRFPGGDWGGKPWISGMAARVSDGGDGRREGSVDGEEEAHQWG